LQFFSVTVRSWVGWVTFLVDGLGQSLVVVATVGWTKQQLGKDVKPIFSVVLSLLFLAGKLLALETGP